MRAKGKSPESTLKSHLRAKGKSPESTQNKSHSQEAISERVLVILTNMKKTKTLIKKTEHTSIKYMVKHSHPVIKLLIKYYFTLCL